MKRTVFLSIILAFCASADAQNIKVKGSAELLPIVDRWANSYSKAHPATPVVSLGGGTSVGWTAAVVPASTATLLGESALSISQSLAGCAA